MLMDCQRFKQAEKGYPLLIAAVFYSFQNFDNSSWEKDYPLPIGAEFDSFQIRRTKPKKEDEDKGKEKASDEEKENQE